MRITQQYLEKKGREVAKVLKNIPEVRAIVFHGGIAWGTIDQHSDIDISVFCTKMPEIKKRQEIIKQHISNVRFNYDDKPYSEKQDIFYLGNLKNYVGVDYYTISEMSTILSKKIKLPGYLAGDHETKKFFAHTWTVKIIWDPDKIVNGWQKELKPYFTRFRKRAPLFIHWAKHFTESDRSHFFNRGDYIGIQATANQATEIYLLGLFLLNNRYLDFSKKVDAKLKNLKYKPKNCGLRLNESAKLGYDERSFKRKMKILGALAEETEPLIKRYM
jgi:predicted nucleotidyltransferase